MIPESHPKISRRLFLDYYKIANITDLNTHWNFSFHQDYDIIINVLQQDYNIYTLNVKLVYPAYMTNITHGGEFLNKNYIGLPLSINYIIADFLPKENIINLNFKISYPDMYPFRHPVWNLESASTSMECKLPNSISFYDYYKYLVDKKNNNYETFNFWSPMLTMEKDILTFLSYLNHFEEIVYYNP